MTEARIELATLSLVVETERALAALDPPAHHAALVALARLYVAAITPGDPGTLALFGPKLTLTMTKLGATARPRTAPAAAPMAPPAPAQPAQRSELDKMRDRREQRAAARTTG